MLNSSELGSRHVGLNVQHHSHWDVAHIYRNEATDFRIAKKRLDGILVNVGHFGQQPNTLVHLRKAVCVCS